MKKRISWLIVFTMLLQLVVFSTASANTLLSAKLSIYDTTAQNVTSIAGLASINGNLTVIGDFQGTLSAYVAVYDGGMLLNVACDSISSGESLSYNFSGLPQTNTQTIKGFVWDANQAPAATVAIAQDQITIRGIYSAGNILSCALTENSGLSADNIASYNWMYSATMDGQYTSIGSSSATYTTADVTGAYYYKVAVTMTDSKVYTSAPVLVAARDAHQQIYSDWKPSNSERTDSDYKFTVDGQEFILLDTIETSDTARYFVMAEDTYPTTVPPLDDYWYKVQDNMNTVQTEVAAVLPTAITDHIDYNVWYSGSYIHNWEYLTGTRNGIAIPSWEEMDRYSAIVGRFAHNYNDATETNVSWRLRNNLAISADTRYFYAINANGAVDGAGDYVRPVFHLDKDFFANEVVDLSKSGSVVKNLLKDNFEYEDLLAIGYADATLEMYYEDPIDIENLAVSGEIKINSTVTASYNISGSLDGAEALLEYKWKMADTIDGAYTTISRTQSLKLDAKKNNKYLKVVVVKPNGDEVESAAVLLNIADTSFTGEISNLEIRGILLSGNKLTFRYDTEDGVTDEDISVYEWYVSGAANGTYTLVGENASYVTLDAASTSYYKLKVILKNGVEYTSDSVAVAGRSVRQTSWNIWTVPNTAEASNEDYRFTIGEQEFVLLDTITTSDTARYYIMAEYTYGSTGTISNYQDLSAQAKTNAISNLVMPLLPTTVTAHIENNAWFSGSLDAWGGYSPGSRGGIGLMSAEEMEIYSTIAGKITYNYNDVLTAPDPQPVVWGLRNNACGTEDSRWYLAISSSGTTTAFFDSSQIRPAFYVDKDFFTDEAANISNAGANVPVPAQ